MVVTVPGTGNKTLEQYSLDLANKWQIGTKGEDNGILLLFTTEVTPHVRLEIGVGLEGDITDGKAGRILDLYDVPYKDKRDYDSATLLTYAELLRIVYHKYNIPIPMELIQENIDKLKDSSSKQELKDSQGLPTNDNSRNKFEPYEVNPNETPMIFELFKTLYAL